MSDTKPKRPAHRPVTIGGVRINLTLDQKTIDDARELGGGNVSAGVRLAIKMTAGTSAGRNDPD